MLFHRRSQLRFGPGTSPHDNGLRLAVFAALVLLFGAWTRAEVIDRILAVVDRELITLSDVAGALRLGLVGSPQAGTDPTRAALDSLIDRQLELAEANRYQPPDPPEPQVEARFQAVRSHFDSPAGFAQALANSGLSEEQLRLRLREDLRIEAYLNQRFGLPRPSSDQELVDYYRAHTAEFSTAGSVRPFADLREEIRVRLSSQQRATLVADWLESLKRRTEIADLYAVGK